MIEPVYLEVRVPERRCDFIVDGVDEYPCFSRDGMFWNPIIELESGKIVNWVEGATSQIEIKVSDTGSYFLLDAAKRRVYKYREIYVPKGYLAHKGNGDWGDFIEFDVDANGFISGYKKPVFNEELWEKLEGELNPHELKQIADSDPSFLLHNAATLDADVDFLIRVFQFAKLEAKKRVDSGVYAYHV